MWTLIGLGVLATTIGDAVFAIQEARGVVDGGRYDFVWTLGALCIAGAAWVTGPGVGNDRAVVTGLRAVILLLVAQAVAAGIQIYALFGELARSERVVTLAVLVVTSVQIILNRPRPDEPTPPQSAPQAQEEEPAGEPVHTTPGNEHGNEHGAERRVEPRERDGPAAGSLSTGDETREAELT
jgi:hypothetical protein